MFKRKTFLLAMSLMLLIPLMVGAVAYAQGGNGKEVPLMAAGLVEPQGRNGEQVSPIAVATPHERQPAGPCIPAHVAAVIKLPYELLTLPDELVSLSAEGIPVMQINVWPITADSFVSFGRIVESPLMLTEAKKAEILAIAKADPRVQELLEQGATPGHVTLRGTLTKDEVLDDGMVALTVVSLEATAWLTNVPGMPKELKNYWENWGVSLRVDLKKGTVVELNYPPPVPCLHLIQCAHVMQSIGRFIERWTIYPPIQIQVLCGNMVPLRFEIHVE